MTDEKPRSDTMVIFTYFGLKEEQTRTDFIQEVKALTEADKAQLASGIRDETYDY